MVGVGCSSLVAVSSSFFVFHHASEFSLSTSTFRCPDAAAQRATSGWKFSFIYPSLIFSYVTLEVEEKIALLVIVVVTVVKFIQHVAYT